MRYDRSLVAEAQKLAGAIPGISSHRMAELLCIYVNAPTMHQLAETDFWLHRFTELETEIRSHIARGRQAQLAGQGWG